MPLALVVAIARGGVIGKGGALPWHLPEDLRHFRRVTTGHAIVMGRKTHASIGKALPGRRNIVVTSRPELVLAGCEAAPGLEAALALARLSDEEPCVIGGAALYAAALPIATRIFLTEIARDFEGDTFFAFDRSEFREVERRGGEDSSVSFVTLVR